MTKTFDLGSQTNYDENLFLIECKPSAVHPGEHIKVRWEGRELLAVVSTRYDGGALVRVI